MIVYKIKNNNPWSVREELDTYVLQENEYSSVIRYQKPFFNGTGVVESITQQEIDNKTEAETQETNLTNARKELSDGQDASIELMAYIKGLGLTGTPLLNAKKALLPVYKALKDGIWDLAKEEIAKIARPNGNFGTVYDTIKTRIDGYS